MGDEAVDGSKMGTKLIFFVAIIGLALVAFVIGKSLVNTGVDGMEQSVQAINDSRFSDYDGKVVRGRAVKSAIRNFANEEVGIVVVTLSEADLGKPGVTPTESNLVGFDGRASTVKITNASMKNSKGESVTDPVGICYNAQLADPKTDAGNAKQATLTMKDGKAIFNEDFSHDSSGNINYYLNTGNLAKKGTGEYVADNSSFNANLITNSAGEICGILFTQRKLN